MAWAASHDGSRMDLTHFQSEFLRLYGRPGAVFRAPARVNIIGEHTDYNDGFVLPVTTALYTSLAIAPRDDGQLHAHAINFGQSGSVALDEIARGGHEPWFEYIKGVAWALGGRPAGLCGADLLLHGGIPIGGGLSSSASLECVVALGLLTVAGLPVVRSRMAQACQRAENEFVGVNCGIMDQYVITLGRRNMAMKLDCRSLELEHVPMPRDAAVLVIDSGVKHALMDGAYNERREDCAAAVLALATRHADVAALRDLTLEQLEAARRLLEPRQYRRARHVLTEIQRVHAAQAALQDQNLEQLGELLNASHASLRDDFEVSCDALDTLTDIARQTGGVLGSRMVGAGFGGCAIALVHRDALQSATDHIARAYARHQGGEPWTHVCTPADAVGAVA